VENERFLVREITTQEGKVSVFPQADFSNPELKTRVQKLGFNPQLFHDLITLNYNHWIGEPVITSYPPTHPVEDLIIRTATTEDNKTIEVTEITPYQPHTMKTRLAGNPNQSIGFEAIYVTKGSITYDVLNGFERRMGSYVDAGKGRTTIKLGAHDLLIIPRPVARQITEVENGTKYIYLGDPWNDNDLPQDIR
jgi:hypothetical protein